MTRTRASVVVLVAGLGLLAPATALAQGSVSAASSAPVRPVNPKYATLVRMMRPVTANLQDQRLEDVVKFIETVTGASLEPMWLDDTQPSGLDKEMLVTMNVENVTALAFVERLLARADAAGAGECTWQLSDEGAFEFGTKERLNTHRRIVIYDINDLLLDIPDYPEVPELDLQSVLQQSQGGGGGQSPFRDNQQQQNRSPSDLARERQDQIDNLVDLIQELVEPNQWIDTGGNGGSIRYFQGSLIVNAPDYIHRQLNGYAFWPQRLTRISNENGRRYVSLGVDTSIGRVEDIAQWPVSAVVGGQVIRSDAPSGGG